jgi:hypothetical protein
MVLMIFDDGWMGLRDGNGSWNWRLVNICEPGWNTGS